MATDTPDQTTAYTPWYERQDPDERTTGNGGWATYTPNPQPVKMVYTPPPRHLWPSYADSAERQQIVAFNPQIDKDALDHEGRMYMYAIHWSQEDEKALAAEKLRQSKRPPPRPIKTEEELRESNRNRQAQFRQRRQDEKLATPELVHLHTVMCELNTAYESAKLALTLANSDAAVARSKAVIAKAEFDKALLLHRSGGTL